ncbi:MAG TPA: hypothetical protein VHW23_36720, partial [Kofleriaceae bacterium]|nr:hypothetical protein [Kofleriaceae bacterium]
MKPGRPGAVLRASLLAAVAWAGLCLGAAPANAQQIAFRKYDQTDGLANLVVLDAVPAPNGNLWVGTEAGVFRFDGTTFVAAATIYGLPRVRVQGIESEPSGRVWIWYKRALFVGSAAGFAPVRTADGDVALDVGSSVVPLADDRFAATVNHQLLGFHRPSPDSPTWISRSLLGEPQIANVPALASARLLARDRRGTLWMSCGDGLCSLDANQPRYWGPTYGVPKDAWAAVLEDRDGRLWARGIHHVSVRERNAERFRANQPAGVSDQKFLAIGLAIDGRGRVLTDVPSGMSRWDGATWRDFTPASGFPAAVSHIGKPDADGNLWLGVEGHGLWRWLGYDSFESWTSSEGFSDFAGFGIARTSPTRLVVGLDHGCQALDEQRRRFEDCPFGPLDGLTVVPVSRGPDGAIWLGSDSGTVWRARPGEPGATPVVTLPPGHLTELEADEHGTWWISSENSGLLKLDGATGHAQQVALPPAAGFPYESVAVNANERCVAT